MKLLPIIQIIVSILLIITILLQSRGTGLSSLFGGSDNVYRTKRGAEKFIFTSTIVLSFAFFGLALANILIK